MQEEKCSLNWDCFLSDNNVIFNLFLITDSCFNSSFFKVCDPVMGDAGKFVSHVKFLCLILMLLF